MADTDKSRSRSSKRRSIEKSRTVSVSSRESSSSAFVSEESSNKDSGLYRGRLRSHRKTESQNNRGEVSARSCWDNNQQTLRHQRKRVNLVNPSRSEDSGSRDSAVEQTIESKRRRRQEEASANDNVEVANLQRPDPGSAESQPETSHRRRVTSHSYATSSTSSNTGSCASNASRRSDSAGRPSNAPAARPAKGRSGMSSTEGATNSAENTNLATSSSIASSRATSDTMGAGASSSSSSGQNIPVSTSHSSEGESDDQDAMNSVQAMLQQRGIPQGFLSSLAPRMSHIFHRSMHGTSSKMQHLIESLKAEDDCNKLTALSELCETLVMGNEETLSGFPVKLFVPILIQLISEDVANLEIVHQACRALAYMMEVLPRSSNVIVEAVPKLIEKLEQIQCMDVAEQCLAALELLSRRHGRTILLRNGIAACLLHLDFFALAPQRKALAIAANCCLQLTAEEFPLVAPSLAQLTQALMHSDKKCVESVCMAFSRLVDNCQMNEGLLRTIASHGLLEKISQLLVMTPAVLSGATFVVVLCMLTTMCNRSPTLRRQLLRSRIAETLSLLLTGPEAAAEFSPRTPQEVEELMALVQSLLPPLPRDGVFAVDALLTKAVSNAEEQCCWQWQDDNGAWHHYSAAESRLVEASFLAGQGEVSLLTAGRHYTIDLRSMVQVNEDTGNTRGVRRRVYALNEANDASSSQPGACPASAEHGAEQDDASCLSQFCVSMFPLVYDVNGSSAGTTIKYRCLKVLLKMIYFSCATTLEDMLKQHRISSLLASMLESSDIRLVVISLQIAQILMDKLPVVFSIYFRREGVYHQMQVLVSGSPKKRPSSAIPSPPSLLHSLSSPPAPTDDAARKVERRALSQRRVKRPTPMPRGRSIHAEDMPPSRSKHAAGQHQQLEQAHNARNPASTWLGQLPAALFRHSSTTPPDSHQEPYLLFRPPTSFASQPCSVTMPIQSPDLKEQIRSWIRDHATKFQEKYYSESSATSSCNVGVGVLDKLQGALDKLTRKAALQSEEWSGLFALREIVCDGDISPFELIHSGFIEKLLHFLTDIGPDSSRDERRVRLHKFVDVFMLAQCAEADENSNQSEERRPLLSLVRKLIDCFEQQEQFPVKIHDFPSSGRSSMLRLFSTHKIKCILQRHPSCVNLKEWTGGAIEVDPLALVSSIEKYLVIKGYARMIHSEEEDSEMDNSDEDVDDNVAAMLMEQLSGSHPVLELLVGDQPLPPNVTLFQALRRCCEQTEGTSGETEGDAHPLGRGSTQGLVWSRTHLIWYRPFSGNAPDGAQASKRPSSREERAQARATRQKDPLWFEGRAPSPQPLFELMLARRLPPTVTVRDKALPALALLRALHTLIHEWYSLCDQPRGLPLLPANEFTSSKLTAKANRQLHDPINVMTAAIPEWLPQLATACPFVFPFDTRQLLFYVTMFDRDRAVHKLTDTLPELNLSDTSDRLPRLDRRKVTVSRKELLKQAESLFSESYVKKGLLEVQYDSEVGTGLGPTLEFYALVSKDLQRADLDMWRGDKVAADDGQLFVFAANGLFPMPLAKNAKSSLVDRVKKKFHFLGRFMAKALMDSRILDLPLSRAFFKWTLGLEATLDHHDLSDIEPVVAKAFGQLQELVEKKKSIERDASKTAEERMETSAALGVEELELCFTLPGYDHVELRKGGKDTPVTADNLDDYLKLVVHWTLVEGVQRQLEAFREGFNTLFPISSMRLFTVDELGPLFCGSPTSQMLWDAKTLTECSRCDHGYTHDSRAVHLLFECMCNFDGVQQRAFLQFMTGSPRLPVGGLRSLNPPLTIVRKTLEAEQNPDDYLPSVMTCVNYLKLPDYSNAAVMREKLLVACSEGQLSFHLS